MSIHKSKGLEFPVVFLCGTGKQFNLMDLNKNILYHDDLGLGPDFVHIEKRVSYSTLAKEAIKQKTRFETLSEEMRILYVAFTRAKEKLIITGATSNLERWANKCCSAAALNDERIISSEVSKGKSYLDWIGMALCKHRNGEGIREEVGPVDIKLKDDLSTWKIIKWKKNQLVVDKDEESVNEEDKKDLLINFDCKALDKNIVNRLNYMYPFKSSTTIKSNFSVSELKKKNQEELELTSSRSLYSEKIVPKPKFLQEERGLTPSERGTAMHFVMQKLDFNRVNNIEEIENQIREMVYNELLSEEEFKVIRVKKIYNFFKSNLGNRVLKAYKSNKVVYKELPFYTEISASKTDPNLINVPESEKVRLQGVIDLFFYEGDSVVLVDYKTDYVEREKEDELIEKYRAQLEYYKEALEKITGKVVTESYLYSFFLDKELRC